MMKLSDLRVRDPLEMEIIHSALVSFIKNYDNKPMHVQMKSHLLYNKLKDLMPKK